jgi:hypothetical protein
MQYNEILQTTLFDRLLLFSFYLKSTKLNYTRAYNVKKILNEDLRLIFVLIT